MYYSIIEFYTVIQSHVSNYKTFKVLCSWVKHFCWDDNIWLNVCVKFFYTDSPLKLNSYYNLNNNINYINYYIIYIQLYINIHYNYITLYYLGFRVYDFFN